MSTITPFSVSSAVNSLSLSLSFGQFNLNNNLNSSLNSSNLNSNNLNSNNLNSNLNSSTQSGSLFVRDLREDANRAGNRPQNLSTLRTNLNRLIRGELHDVHLCNKLKLPHKKDRCFNVNKFLNQRSYGNRTPKLSTDFGLQHLIQNSLLTEHQIDLGTVDKIYSSCWLDDDYVLCGTKCNKLILINVNNKKHYHLPVVQSSQFIKTGGFYSIATNPSRKLLATGTADGNDIAIYGLPSLDILFRLEKGHDDLIFDVVWLDDELLLSGSRDSNLTLWRVKHDGYDLDPKTDLPVRRDLEPSYKFHHEEIDKIRCMNFMRTKNEIGVLSSNCKLHSIDALTMTVKNACDLTYRSDLCSLAQNEDHLYAVGSNSHIQLVDSRSLSIVSTINSRTPECRIRSMSFNSEILTVTTGIGGVLFYDIRNSKYIQNRQTKELVLLKASTGWIQPSQENPNYGGYFTHPDLPAIYTHSYDQGKTRLFTAGGPLQATMAGNYCSIWF